MEPSSVIISDIKENNILLLNECYTQMHRGKYYLLTYAVSLLIIRQMIRMLLKTTLP